MADLAHTLFSDTRAWLHPNQGPRYLQLYRHISMAIHDGRLPPNAQLPPERDIAAQAGVSRVTVRKAIRKLVDDGTVIQRQGAGSFVRTPGEDLRMEHSLSTLTSFTEYMRLRGIAPNSRVISAGIHAPTPMEKVALGLEAGERASRVTRLRMADGIPMALETSSLPSSILPDPHEVITSLYDVLRKYGRAPVRAMQRINARSLPEPEAELLGIPPGSAVLHIDRTSYLKTGRPIEFTTGFYRSDMYDFVAELRLDPPA